MIKKQVLNKNSFPFQHELHDEVQRLLKEGADPSEVLALILEDAEKRLWSVESLTIIGIVGGVLLVLFLAVSCFVSTIYFLKIKPTDNFYFAIILIHSNLFPII